MPLRQLGMKIVQANQREEIPHEGLVGTIVEANRNPRRQLLQAVLDSRPRPTALYAANPCDQTASRQHAQSLLDLRDPRLACRQSRFQVDQADVEIEVLATMISTAGLTDPPNKDSPAKDPQAIEAAQERQKGTQEILMGLNGATGRTARDLGGLLLMPVILARSLEAPPVASRCHRSRCPAPKQLETMFVHHPSGNLFLHSRCLARGRSLASRPSVNLFLRSRCLRPTIHLTTATEGWAHHLRNRPTLNGFLKLDLRALPTNNTPAAVSSL